MTNAEELNDDDDDIVGDQPTDATLPREEEGGGGWGRRPCPPTQEWTSVKMTRLMSPSSNKRGGECDDDDDDDDDPGLLLLLLVVVEEVVVVGVGSVALSLIQAGVSVGGGDSDTPPKGFVALVRISEKVVVDVDDVVDVDGLLLLLLIVVVVVGFVADLAVGVAVSVMAAGCPWVSDKVGAKDVVMVGRGVSAVGAGTFVLS